MTTEDAVNAPAVRTVLSALLELELDPAQDGKDLSTLHERYDSLAVLDAVGEIEKAFSVSIDLVDDDLRSTFVSVASITALVRRKQEDAKLLESAF